MANTKHEVYMSDGPCMERAVIVSGSGEVEKDHSSPQTSSSRRGDSRSTPEQSMIKSVAIGSMPVVNQISVKTNPDGTIGINTTVADATPETGPGISPKIISFADTCAASTAGMRPGWVQIGSGYKYYKEDGSGYKTGWHFEYHVDGTKIWYYFDENLDNIEWMVTGWKKIKRFDGVLSWYHFRLDGKMSVCWVYYKNMWYYLEPRDDAGYLVTDWHIINNQYYYFVPDDVAGYMMINWFKIRDKWYYFYNTDEKRGMMAYNYLMRHTDGKLYFLQDKEDGSMAVNKQITDPATGIVYYADENGVCTEVITKNDMERWMQVVKEISLWYVKMINTYQKETKKQGDGSGERRYYSCDLIDPLKAGDDCSGHLNAILVRYGILFNSTDYSSWSYNKASNPKDKTVINALEDAGFVWYAYDSNCIPMRGDIHVQHNNANHVEVIDGYNAQNDSTRIWSWGAVQSSLPITRQKDGKYGWRTRASGYWRMSGVTDGNETLDELCIDIPQDGELGTFITYMGWHKIKTVSSNQYKLRENAKSTGRASIANPEYFAVVDDRILIATKQDIGGKLYLEIGDYVDVLFKKQDGTVSTYECIIGDFKGKDAPGIWGHNNGRSVVEMIYWDYSPPIGYNRNTNDPWGKGRVIRITKTGSYFS